MTLIQSLIILLIGVLLVARPQAFTKPKGTAADVAARHAQLQKIGYGVVVVGLVLLIAALVVPQRLPSAR